jgi:hypothetical protein
MSALYQKQTSSLKTNVQRLVAAPDQNEDVSDFGGDPLVADHQATRAESALGPLGRTYCVAKQ